MRIKNALVYTVEHGFVERDVRIKNGCFAGSEAAGTDGEEILDAGGDYLIPGLVDIHFHGCAGHDFSDGTPEALQAIGAYELRQGVTSICPASMTLSEETLKTVCANAYAYTKRPEAEQDTGARLIGIHLEGPFISMEKKGAQNPAYIRNPDVEMFLRLQEAAHGLVRLITIAPETDGAKEFIRRLADQGPCVMIGRCADYILRDKADCLKVFIHADMKFRAERIVKVYGEREQSPEERLRDKDKRRAAYHRFYTNMKWGHAQNYHLTLDSGVIGIDKCVDIIAELY